MANICHSWIFLSGGFGKKRDLQYLCKDLKFRLFKFYDSLGFSHSEKGPKYPNINYKNCIALAPNMYVPDVNSQNQSWLKLRKHWSIYMLGILRDDIFNFSAGLSWKRWRTCRHWMHVSSRSYGCSHCLKGKNMQEVDLKTTILMLTTLDFLSKLADWWQNILIGILFIWGGKKKSDFVILFSSCQSCKQKCLFFPDHRFFW